MDLNDFPTHIEFLSGEADDQRLIEALLQTCLPFLQTLFYNLYQSPEEAEKVVQETFNELIARLDRYPVGTNFKVWLTRLALDIDRRHNRRKSLQSTFSRLLDSSQDSGGVIQPEGEIQGDTLSYRGALRGLNRVVATYDKKARLILISRFGLQLTIGEIAELLRETEAAIIAQLDQACLSLWQVFTATHSDRIRIDKTIRNHLDVRNLFYRQVAKDEGTQFLITRHVETCQPCQEYHQFLNI